MTPYLPSRPILMANEAKLLALLMRSGWTSSQTELGSAFPGQFVSAIIHNINERAYDAIEDRLIEDEADTLAVGTEYHAALERALKLTDNCYIENERNRL